MSERSELAIGGFVPLSSGDYPDALAAVVFCQGCPWRCRYCHNPHLQPRHGGERLTWRTIQAFLARRVGLLDAIVFSGGEPTLQAGLQQAVSTAKSLGFAVGLHTAGIYPERLERLLPLLDWVGMDVKAPFPAYARVIGDGLDGHKARKSVELLLKSGIECEFRTTFHPALLSRDDVLAIARTLARMGAERYVLQTFRAAGCVDRALAEPSLGAAPDALLCREVEALIPRFSVRGA